MKLAILCLCLASSASAAPFLHYLPHFGGSRQGPPTQGNNGGYPLPQMQPGMAPISMEIVFPHRFGGGPSIPGQSFPSQAFIKYSIPQAPGRKSVEIYYPYDFNKHQIMPNMPPMPQLPNMFPFGDYPPQTGPQQYPPQTVPQQYPPQTVPQQYPPQTVPRQYPPETVPQQTLNRVATFDAPPQSRVPSQPVPRDQPVQASQAPAANQ